MNSTLTHVSGTGLGSDMSAVSVAIGDSDCVVTSLTGGTMLECTVVMAAGGLQDVSVAVDGSGRAELSQTLMNVSGLMATAVLTVC